MFKRIRIITLLFLLVLVGGVTLQTKLRSTDWDIPLEVVIFPLNPEKNALVDRYISRLASPRFKPIEDYLTKEAKRHGVKLLRPVTVELGPEIKATPPPPPHDGNALEIIWWSLRMRWWAWHSTDYTGPLDVRMFVEYYDPARHRELDHSIGLQKGMIGVVNAFADSRQEGGNNLIITHEFLHTLGATDKYAPESGRPIFPRGYAEPERKPLYPQTMAEIMGGVIPISATETAMPEGLKQTVVGPVTAGEIGW